MSAHTEAEYEALAENRDHAIGCVKVLETRVATLEAALASANRSASGFQRLLKDQAQAFPLLRNLQDKLYSDCIEEDDLRNMREMIDAVLSGARTAEPVSGAGQYCHLCRNVHDLLSACPPASAPANAKGEGKP